MRVAGAKTPAKSTVVNLTVAAAPAFDAALYSSLQTRFHSAVAGCSDDSNFEQVMRALVKQEFDAGGQVAALSLRPYIVKYMCEHRARVAHRV